MDSTVFLFPSLSLSMGRGRAERRRRRGRRRKGGGERFGVSREDHRPIICFDMIFRVFALASLAEWAFKLPREIKLLRVSSRYYTHAPPIESPPLPALLYPFWIRCAYNIKKPLWFRTINKIRGWTPLIRPRFGYSSFQPRSRIGDLFDISKWRAGPDDWLDVCFEVLIKKEKGKMKIDRSDVIIHSKCKIFCRS